MLAKKTFEINPHHPVIKELLSKVKMSGEDEVDTQVVEYADMLYNMALLNSGFLVDDPAEFNAPI
jgi:HSP90 family molecular chaperone